MSALSLRGAVRWTAAAARAHKVVTGSIVVFAVAIIAVSLLTGGTPPKSEPAAASFSLTALGEPGAKVSLSQYAGKPVIINFWASWCGPCQQETPLLAKWYKQQGGRVVLLGLDENDDPKAALKFASAKGITYPIGSDPTMITAGTYGVDALPQTFFLNAQHHIVDHIAGAVTTAELATGLSLMQSTS